MPKKKTIEEQIEKLQKLRHILRDEISRQHDVKDEHHKALAEAVKLQVSLNDQALHHKKKREQDLDDDKKKEHGL